MAQRKGTEKKGPFKAIKQNPPRVTLVSFYPRAPRLYPHGLAKRIFRSADAQMNQRDIEARSAREKPQKGYAGRILFDGFEGPFGDP